MIFSSCVIFSSCRNKMKSDKLNLSTTLLRKFYRNKITEVVFVCNIARRFARPFYRGGAYFPIRKSECYPYRSKDRMRSLIGTNRRNRRFVMPRLTWNTSTMPGVMHVKRGSVLRISWRNAMNEGTAISAHAGERSVTAGVSALLLLNGRLRLIARQYSK